MTADLCAAGRQEKLGSRLSPSFPLSIKANINMAKAKSASGRK
jgi:hypothetical protein